MTDVAITGMAVILPQIDSIAEFTRFLKEGRSTIRHLPDALGTQVARIGGHMIDFDLHRHLDECSTLYGETPERLKRFLRQNTMTTTTAVLAALQAVHGSGIPLDQLRRPDVGSIYAAQDVGLRYTHDNVRRFMQHPDDIDIMYGIHHMDEDGLGAINQLLGITGPSYTVGAACATGNVALQNALDLIRTGQIRRALVCATAMDIDACAFDSIAELGGTVADAQDPTTACRPFDAARSGFVPAQGAGALLLERGDDALRRGATIHGWLLGASLCANAKHTTKPSLKAQTRVIHDALRDARLQPTDIDYINAHATGTPLGDQIEADTIQLAFGEHASSVWVNATKSLIGHTTTAAPLIEAIAVLIQMHEGWLHPTRNLTNPTTPLRLVGAEGHLPYRPQRALNNGFGYGGFSSTLVLGAPSILP